MKLQWVLPHAQPRMSSNKAPRLNAKLILQPPQLKLPTAPKQSTSKSAPLLETVVPTQTVPTRKRVRNCLYSEAVYRREDAVKMLLVAVFDHFEDFVYAEMFLAQKFKQLGNKTPVEYSVCKMTVAKALSCLQILHN